MYAAMDHVTTAYDLGSDSGSGSGSGSWTIEPVTRGALGRIWKMSGPSGDWAVKEMLFGCDEHQVRREAALRDASEALGITSPRLLKNSEGAHVTRLPPHLGGSCLKLYDWVDGTGADPTAPEILAWVGRTLALLHTAGAGATEAPSAWHDTCPTASEWQALHQKTAGSGLPWSDELADFPDRATEFSRHVTPAADRTDLVTSHLDVQPQNVLVGRDGPVLIDWDNAGSTTPGRELAWVVYAWSGRNRPNLDAARQLVRAYVAAGGPGTIRTLNAFSMLLATSLNYIQVQAEAALDPTRTPDERAFADDQVRTSLSALPDLPTLSLLIKELAPEW
ncbi:phosphotransferase enzyme family protein [Streptomyces gilvus]|uniref:phosphotransferase enzyme family protein n=1 Tax=Streptomyces gilvus TaxID=2920937 RepID=UPI001F0D3EB2|nr:aminoglycoside phosphotransferase family protein [Streptomyces sp. CME 23]MCH5673989.1 aminoglycoside phosphotransferase family protein [Streptomyces sp. CME 23]